MDTPSEPPVVNASPSKRDVIDGVIDRQVPCAKCGYNLRGLRLDEDAACPECGAGLERSMDRHRLALADPAWLLQLSAGATWIIVGTLFGGLMFVALAAMGVANLVPAHLELLVAWGMGIVPGTVITMGGWRLTSPEPGGVDEQNLVRRITRWCVVGVLGLACLTGPLALVGERFAGITMMMGGFLTTVGGFTALWYGRSLALRGESRVVAHFSTAFFVIFAVCTSMSIVGGMFAAAIEAMGGWDDDATGVLALVQVILVIGTILAFVVVPLGVTGACLGSFVLLFGYRAMFLRHYRRVMAD